MWGIFVDNKPLCLFDKESFGSLPFLFEDKNIPVAIANEMNKNILTADVSVRPVEIRVHKPEKDYRLNEQ